MRQRFPGCPAQAGSPGHLASLTCPDCGGTLWHLDDYGTQRYRCRVGHAFSADNLMVGKQAAIEAALWAAVPPDPHTMPPELAE